MKKWLYPENMLKGFDNFALFTRHSEFKAVAPSQKEVGQMSPFYPIMHAVFPHNALGLCSSVSEYGIAQIWPYKAEVVSISSWDTETQFRCLSSVKMDLVEYKWIDVAFYLIYKYSDTLTKKNWWNK